MNPFDPLGSLADAIRNAYVSFVQIFQQGVASPADIVNHDFQNYVFANAQGVYFLLASSVFYVTMIIALFYAKGRVSFAMALLILLVTAVVGPIWFSIVDQFKQFGDELTQIALSIGDSAPGSTHGNLLPIAHFSDPIFAIGGFGTAFVLAGFLYCIILGYEYVSTVAQFLGLISLSLLALGTRSRKVFSMIMSVMIVTLVLGRFTAVLILSVGLGVGRVTDDFTLVVLTIVSLLAAILAQPLLFSLMYNSISPIVGRVAANVTGKVRTAEEKVREFSARGARDAYSASLQARAAAIGYGSSGRRSPGYIRIAATELGSIAVYQGAKYIKNHALTQSIKTAATTHPVGRAAIAATAFAKVVRAKKKQGG